MSRAVTTALRVCIALIVAGTVLAQVVVIPAIAAGSARAFPEVAHLRWPYTAAAEAVVLCAQVALVAIWVLLSMVRFGEVFDGRALRWVDVVIGSGLVATLLPAGVAVHLFGVVGTGGPGEFLLLGAAVVGGCTFVLLMVVMRGLLRSATAFKGELAEIV